MDDTFQKVLLACGGLPRPNGCTRRPEDAALGEGCPDLAACVRALHPWSPCTLVRFELHADGSTCLPFTCGNFPDVQHADPEALRQDTMPVFRLLHPQDFDRVLISMTQAARSISPWLQEYRILPSQGDLRWLRSCLVPHRSGQGLLSGYGLITDITAERKCRDDLLALCESGPVGVYRAAEDGALLAVNAEFARICGYDTPEEMLDAVPSTIGLYNMPPEERTTVMRLVRTYGSVQRYAIEARTRDGGRVWLSLNVREVPGAEGEPLTYEGYCADITGQMRHEMAAGHVREFDRTRFGEAPPPPKTEKPAGSSADGLCPLLSYVRDAILWRVRLPRLA
ncbi:MAG: PAS domain S-box protein [Desulfovibrio sp.]|nr:PAS domain S-box protein [Desulfovibrio sp.]